LAIKHRLASSSSLDEELDEEISFSSQAMYALFDFAFFSFLLAFFSLFWRSAFMCPYSPRP